MRPRAVVPLGGMAVLLGCAGAMAPVAQVVAAPRLLLVDVDADPLELGGHPGALFEIDPRGGRVRLLFTSRELADPVDVLGEPDGSLLVADLCRLGGEGRLFRVAADGSSVRRVAEDAPLVDPTALARAPDGSVWVVDRGVEFRDTPGPGAVFRLSADLSRCDVIASGAPLCAPADLCFRGGRAYVLDADALRHEISELSEGALFAIDLPDARGTPTATTSGPDARVQLVAQLHLVSPLSMAAASDADDGVFLIADANTDPQHGRRLFGGLYRLAADGVVTFLAQDPGWRDPCSVARFAGGVLVVDGSSDPLGLGDDPVGLGFGGKGRGAIYSFDPAKNSVRLFCASHDFVNPSRLRVVP